MPVTWQKKHNDFSIVVWKSEEPIDVLLENAALNEGEINEWNSFRSESRKREWLTVRNAMHVLFDNGRPPSIFYDSNRKPRLTGEGFISISHSHEYIALMKSKESEIGVDIESINERIIKLSGKFLSDIEKRDFFESDIDKLHAMWGAKEVLYKIHSIGNIDFKKDLRVDPFEYQSPGTLSASLLKKGYEKRFEVFYEKIGGQMVSWAHG